MATIDTPLTLSTVVQRNSEHVLSSPVGDELVMMDTNSGNYISLNKIGRVIWEQIENPVEIAALITYLTGRFNVDAAVCESDTLEYLQKMQMQNMLTIL